MKKFLLLFIIHFSLFIGVAFSQSGWMVQSPLPTDKNLNAVKYLNGHVAIAVGGLLYTEASGILLKTYNDGITWTTKEIGKKTILYDLFFVNSTTGFVVGDSMTLMKTTDAGETWLNSIPEKSNYSNTSVNFINENTGFVYNDSGVVLKTTNCGLNWIKYNTGIPSANFAFLKVYFINENTGFIGLGENLRKTTNGGLNWFLYPIGIQYFLVTNFYFLNESTGFLIGAGGAVCKTTNSGMNWTLIAVLTSSDLNSIKFVNSNTGFTVGGPFIFKTTNQGVNWDVSGLYVGDLTSIDFVSENNGMIVGGAGKIAMTSNGGQNWDITSSGTTIWLYNASCVNRDICVTVGDAEIYKTLNGGVNWTCIGKWDTPFRHVYFANANTGMVASHYYVYTTTNGGNYWNSLNFGYEINDIFFSSPNAGYANSGNLMFKTTNMGESWFQCSILSTNWARKLFFINDLTGYAYQGNIIKTTDGGYNWNTIASGLPAMSFLHFVDSLNGYAYFDVPNSFAKTTNGGINWSSTTIPQVENVTSLFFRNKNTGYLGIEYNSLSSIIRTTNGGNNWVLQYTGNYNINTLKFLDTNVGYAFGNGVILKTTNGGSVWVSNNTQEIPKDYQLFQNYPNPFNPTTNIRYQITKSNLVTIKVYDLLGKEIETLVYQKQKPGIYEVQFDGSALASGVYFYRIQAGDFIQVKKMLLIK